MGREWKWVGESEELVGREWGDSGKRVGVGGDRVGR